MAFAAKTRQEFNQEPANFQIVHLTGQEDNSSYEALAAEIEVPVKILTGTTEMQNFFQAADLIICRAGASSLAEIASFGKPALFIPFAAAAENHQYRNADLACRQGAAELLEEKELSGDSLRKILQAWLENNKEWMKKAEAMKKLARDEASQTIVNSIISSC